jgi:hypothetical protein
MIARLLFRFRYDLALFCRFVLVPIHYRFFLSPAGSGAMKAANHFLGIQTSRSESKRFPSIFLQQAYLKITVKKLRGGPDI